MLSAIPTSDRNRESVEIFRISADDVASISNVGLSPPKGSTSVTLDHTHAFVCLEAYLKAANLVAAGCCVAIENRADVCKIMHLCGIVVYPVINQGEAGRRNNCAWLPGIDGSEGGGLASGQSRATPYYFTYAQASAAVCRDMLTGSILAKIAAAERYSKLVGVWHKTRFTREMLETCAPELSWFDSNTTMNEHYQRCGLPFSNKKAEKLRRWNKYSTTRLWTGTCDALGRGRRAVYPTVDDILDYGARTGRPGNPAWRHRKALCDVVTGVDRQDNLHC